MLSAQVTADVLPKITFTQWYEAFVKVFAENELITKFNEKFSVMQGGLNQICSTDITKYPGSLIGKPGKLFGAIESPEANSLIGSDVNSAGQLIDPSGNEETLLAYGGLINSPTDSNRNLIAFGIGKRKIIWNDVKSAGNKVAEPVKNVGKKVEQGGKKVVAKAREVVKEGKQVFVKAENAVQKAQDGFCSLTRNLRGLDIQELLKKKLTFPAYRWPDQKGSNVVCENGTTDLSKCGEYRRFSFLPNKVKKYAKRLGTFKFPSVPAGFDRTVWRVDQRVVAK